MLSVFRYLWQERFPLLAILGFFILGCLLTNPLRNVPIIDDWTYAWSVEHLLKTGRLAVLDWSAHYPILQTFWGGLFAFIFGFSFGALRLSTVCLAFLGCAALYLTLRELDFNRERSLAGAFALAVNPIFFVLSFSFMTDAPFLCMMNLAALCYVAGIRRDQQKLLWLGGLFAAAAFLSRQIGILIPLILAPYLLQRWKEWSWPIFFRRLLPIVTPILFIASLWLWMSKSLGRTSVMAQKLEGLPYLFSLGFIEYFEINFQLIFQLAFCLFPLLIAGIYTRPRWKLPLLLLLTVTGALLLLWRFGSTPPPLEDGMTWSLSELAHVRGLMRGTFTEPGPCKRFLPLTLILMLISTAALVAGSVSLLLKTRGRIGKAAAVLAVSGLLQLGLINVLWFYYDRYYLVLFPTLIYLSLKIIPASRAAIITSWIGIAILAFISITGVWDALRFNQACLDACDYLRANGVPAAKIDAGYSLTGWTLYAHPENLSPGENPNEDVTWVTSDKELPYVISNTPLPGYETMKEIHWKGSVWAVSNSIYILHARNAPN